MTTFLPFFGLSDLVEALLKERLGRSPKPTTSPDAKEAETESVRDLILRHPEAFRTDCGIYAMMTQYPRHF